MFYEAARGSLIIRQRAKCASSFFFFFSLRRPSCPSSETFSVIANWNRASESVFSHRLAPIWNWRWGQWSAVEKAAPSSSLFEIFPLPLHISLLYSTCSSDCLSLLSCNWGWWPTFVIADRTLAPLPPLPSLWMPGIDRTWLRQRNHCEFHHLIDADECVSFTSYERPTSSPRKIWWRYAAHLLGVNMRRYLYKQGASQYSITDRITQPASHEVYRGPYLGSRGGELKTFWSYRPMFSYHFRLVSSFPSFFPPNFLFLTQPTICKSHLVQNHWMSSFD